jgi:hypothetical protein
MFLNKSISRRAMLRGMGTTVALPFLDAMVPAFAATTAKAPVCRMAFVYVPNGIIMDQWLPAGAVPPSFMPTQATPETVGARALPEQLPRVSAGLAPFRNDITMLAGLTCNGGRALGDGPGDHGRAGASYLTGVHPKKTFGKDIQAGVSMDQIAARALEGKTRFASLELGCEEGVQGGNCDNGYSCAYSNAISWRTPSSPMPPEIRPRAVFERLFGSVDDETDPKKRARQAGYQRSVLDVVMGDAQRLRGSLGGSDRRKLDEYLFAIRDVEKRIDKADQENARVKPGLPAPSSSVPTDLSEHAQIMFDLIALAFQTDMTRVITMLLGIEQSPRSYAAELGITEAHHGLTHHQGDKEKIEKVTQINCFHVKQYAYLLNKLKSIPDGDGTLLDHSMICYGSGLSDGNGHLHHNLPLVIAGRGAGTVKPGRYVRYADETPMTNLFVAMLDRMSVKVESFGDSNGELGYLTDL